MKVRFNCMIMKKQSFSAILMLLAAVLLAACSSDSSEEEQPPVKANPLLGKWGLYCKDYRKDTIPNEYFDIPEDTSYICSANSLVGVIMITPIAIALLRYQWGIMSIIIATPYQIWEKP